MVDLDLRQEKHKMNLDHLVMKACEMDAIVNAKRFLTAKAETI